jgi:hypothetical protein
MSLTKMHLRISGNNSTLSSQREAVLAAALERVLELSPGMIEHDHAKPTLRGEIASFWLKMGGGR